MTQHSFALIPFPDSHIPELMITGGIAREQNLLTVQYFLTGDLENVLFPEPAFLPGRRDDLWRHTCFEFFMAITDQPQYWEFNLSPSGDWNVFRMEAYRSVGFQQEELIREMRLEISRELNRFRMDAAVDLSAILESKLEIQAGVTSVIETQDGHETFWALAHPGPHADFHLRESFILAL